MKNNATNGDSMLQAQRVAKNIYELNLNDL